MTEKTEVIFRWHRGESKRAIARSLGIARKTVRSYVNIAIDAGLTPKKPLPVDHEVASLFNQAQATKKTWPTPAQDQLIPFDEQLAQWAKDPSISQMQMFRLFKEEHPEIQVGKTAFKAYIAKHHRPKVTKSTVRLQTPPGQAQVDFGYVGKMFDPEQGKARKAWAFVMTLSDSRHRFVRFVFSQDVKSWIDCHIRAFEFFGGVPRIIVLDNLKAGVLKPDIYDPTFNRTYQECERYYGFAADPAKVYSPQHKGRVERCIPGVRSHLLAGRHFADINAANQRALVWCAEEIGMIPHGTTKEAPIERFEKTDRGNLLALPSERFEITHWQQAKVSHDHHVVFNGAYYSLPTRFRGEQVDIRGSQSLIHIFHCGELVKTHIPTPKGTFQTDPNDYPEKQRFFLLNSVELCREKALEMGLATSEVMNQLLQRETNRNLRKAQKLLRLGSQYGEKRLEQICKEALRYETLSIQFFEGALAQPVLSEEEPNLLPPAPGFLREAGYFTQSGGEACATI